MTEKNKSLTEEAAKTLADFKATKKDAEGFFAKHKTTVIICGVVLALIILVLAVL